MFYLYIVIRRKRDLQNYPPENPVNQDSIKTVPPTIDEIIEKGIPNDNNKIKEGISYETDEYSVIEGVIKPGQAISHILDKYNISNTDIYKLNKLLKIYLI